ncbi:MAG: putative O-glycosylation ligase, exosortase A system-associated [Magnetococcales bacterium]|nr:putative O-glycosylation ligase, exosortase A system-associated [Magnetococcales bacterium]
MRDLVLTLFVFSLLPFTFTRPFIGLLMWTWIAYMNPHRLTWGFAYNFRFNLIISLVTILGTILTTRMRFKIPWRFPVYLLALFTFWTWLSTQYAYQQWPAALQLDRFLRIEMMVLITLILMKNNRQIITMVMVIAFSFGFYGVKGGIFTLTTGGMHRVMGPQYTFFVDNNAFALAMLMVIPLIYFIQLQLKYLILRLLMIAVILLTMLSVLGSYSRGGFVGLSVMGITFWLKSRHKFTILLSALLIGSPTYHFMPDNWHKRMDLMIRSGMDTLMGIEKSPKSARNKKNFDIPGETEHVFQDLSKPSQDMLEQLSKSDSEIVKDKSVSGRLDAWKFSLRLANAHPFLGGGFATFDQSVYDKFMPGVQRRAPHSIYFEVLAEQGYVGFLIWMSLHISALWTGRRIIQLARRDPELLWARDLAAMLQVSLLSYYAAGLFLGMAYFDLPYQLIAILIVLVTYTENYVIEKQQKTTPYLFSSSRAAPAEGRFPRPTLVKSSR